MVIRKATIEDADSLRALYHELEKDAVRFQPEHFVIGNRETSFFENIFQKENQDIVISKTLRCEGIGTKLLEACKEYGRQNGADFMRTQVFPQNVRGMQFYERQGFSEKMKTIETYL